MFAGGETGKVARLMWGRVLVRSQVATVGFNVMMAAMDKDRTFLDRYKLAWEEGRLRWLDVDVTPIYRGLGGSSEKRKYFSLAGHFRDPLRWLFQAKPQTGGIPDPIFSMLTTAKHKSSVVSRMLFEALTGTDWAGRPFTTFGELLGIDDKGVYKTSKADEYEAGDPKGGKLAGQTVKGPWEQSHPLALEQLPSFGLHTAKSWLPIPLQQGISFLAGELDAFDAATRSVGLMTSTTYPQPAPTEAQRVSLAYSAAGANTPPQVVAERIAALKAQGITKEEAVRLLHKRYTSHSKARVLAVARLRKRWRAGEAEKESD